MIGKGTSGLFSLYHKSEYRGDKVSNRIRIFNETDKARDVYDVTEDAHELCACFPIISQ